MQHRLQDEVGLELARRVAAQLRQRPELLQVAHDNLANWLRQNSGAPSLVRCYEEWKNLLVRPLPEICDLLCADTEESCRLRQNSPFAGILPPAEVWAVKAAIRQRHAKTAA